MVADVALAAHAARARDAGFLHRTLTSCLLTDDELARGENAWTGRNRLMDTAGRVEKLRAKHARTRGGQ